MRVTVVTAVAVVLLSFSFFLGGQDPSQSPPQEESYPTPEPYIDRVKAEGPVVEIAVKDAIRLALTNNLELQIENYNEEINRELVFGTKGFYDPRLQFYLGLDAYERPNTSQLQGLTVRSQISKRVNFDTSLIQNVKGGGNFRISFNNDRYTVNNDWVFIDPQYNANLDFRFTQPLWRGFRRTPTERQLKVYNLNTEISDSAFKQRVSEIVQQVQNQYWELAYAIANYETRRGSLRLAIVQYEDNKKRVKIGVMAPIEITSSRAEAATREQELIQSRVEIINAQNGFKGLVAPDPRDDIWNVNFIPTDKPLVQEVQITLDKAIQTALERRPEIEQINFELEKTGVDREYYRKEGKPSINFEFGVVSQGTAGSAWQTIQDEDGNPVRIPNPTYPLNGTFVKSWNQMVRFTWPNFLAGVRVEIPLRNRSNKAELAQLSIRERQWLSRLKNTQQSIMIDVRNAYEGIATQKEGLEAATVARELSEEQLAGESKRFEAGLTTNFNVLRYQRDLADAQVRELRAMVNYQLGLTALQKATFTIVEDSDILLAKQDETMQDR